jgi:VCBS repeat protein/IPT/TIG domain-containing protein
MPLRRDRSRRSSFLSLAVLILAISIGLLPSNAGAGSTCPSFFDAPPSSPHGGDVVVQADMNNDGRLDVVITTYNDSLVSVVLGNGDGTFGAATHSSSSHGPNSVAIDDFNKDGKKDVAVSNMGSNAVAIFLGTGGGALANAVYYTVGKQPVQVRVVDLNKDGKTDLLVVNESDTAPLEGGISVMLGNGDGTFSVLPKMVLGFMEDSVAVADFNGDHQVDLALTNFNNDQIAILIGNGDGTFHAAPKLAGGHAGIQSADFNHDGKADLMAGFLTGVGFSIFFGNGDATFSSPVAYNIGFFGGYLIDLNGDGNLDMPLLRDGVLAVALGSAAGTFQVIAKYQTRDSARGFALGDFDSDGHDDLILVSFMDCACMWFIHGRGNGFFDAPVALDATGLGGSPITDAVGDFDGNGIDDIAVVTALIPTGSVSIFLGRADGTFAPPAVYGPLSVKETVYWEPAAILARDVNGDGRSDAIITSPDHVGVYLSNADGSLAAPILINTAGTPVAIAAGDFNHDGHPDLATANAESNDVSILLGSGTGAFAPAATYPAGTSPISITVANLNNDGNIDLAVANAGSGTVSVLLGNGNGTFATATAPLVGTRPTSIAAGDFNRDHRDDLVVAKVAPPTNDWPPLDDTIGGFSLLIGKGDGTFAPPMEVASGALAQRGFSRGIVAEDFDGDGRLDVAMTNSRASSVSVLRGNGDGTFAAPVNFNTGPSPWALAAGDFNRDGRRDLVVANNGSATASILENRTVCPPALPSITALSAAYGSTGGGETLTITGTHLDAAISVMFGGVAATSIIENTASSIRVLTPGHGAGCVDVHVITQSGTAKLPQAYTFRELNATDVPAMSPWILVGLAAVLGGLAALRIRS